MITDTDVLEPEDKHILDRLKDFVSSPDVVQLSAAQNLLNLIERAVSSDIISTLCIH